MRIVNKPTKQKKTKRLENRQKKSELTQTKLDKSTGILLDYSTPLPSQGPVRPFASISQESGNHDVIVGEQVAKQKKPFELNSLRRTPEVSIGRQQHHTYTRMALDEKWRATHRQTATTLMHFNQRLRGECSCGWLWSDPTIVVPGSRSAIRQTA